MCTDNVTGGDWIITDPGPPVYLGCGDMQWCCLMRDNAVSDGMMSVWRVNHVMEKSQHMLELERST